MVKFIIPNKRGKNGIGAKVWNPEFDCDHIKEPTCERIPILDRIAILGEAGITYITAHDAEISADDVPKAKQLMEEHDVKMGVYTASFFTEAIFKDSVAKSNNFAICKEALDNALRAVDMTVHLGAELMVFWTGRGGFNGLLDGQKSVRRLIDWLNAVGRYALKQYGKKSPRFALEPVPNNPRSNMYLGNLSVALNLIGRLDAVVQPLFGINPETAHSRMAGLDYLWDVELCLKSGKLFHIRLNSQDATRYDQDLPFGYVEPLKDLALCVALQDAKWEGILTFDVKTPRTARREDIADMLRASAANLQRLWVKALSVDRKIIFEFRKTQRYTALAGYLSECLY
jgi:xylose isomerase